MFGTDNKVFRTQSGLHDTDEARNDTDWTARGESQFAVGNYEEARRCFEKALQERPFDIKVHNNLSVAHWQMGRTEEALRHLTQALELNPDDQDVIFNCSKVFGKLGRKEDAREVLEAYLKRNPWDNEVRVELEGLSVPAGKSQTFDPAPFFNDQGESQFAKGNKERARVCFEMALEHDPRFARAYNNLGVLYWDRGELDEALQNLHKALELDPDDPEILYNGAKVLTAAGQVETATDLLQLYLQKYPQDETAWQDYRHLISESACAWKNDGLAPEVADIYLSMGQSLAEAKDSLGAAEAFRRAAILDPRCAAVYYHLGKLHLCLGQESEAIEMFKEGLDKEPGFKPCLLALGETLAGKGLHEEARRFYQGFLAGHEDGEVEALLAKMKNNAPGVE